MKKITAVIVFMITSAVLFAGESIRFDDYFIDKTMRIDFLMTGNTDREIITIDQIYRQGIWAGNPDKLIEEFNNGSYYIKVYSINSNKLIYSRGFSCLFAEYKTTKQAKEGANKTYLQSALIPYPKKAILFVVEARNRKNILHQVFTEKIDPADANIIKEEANKNDRVYEALKNGDPHKKVDFVFVAEGYTAEQWDKFTKDVDRFTEVLFTVKPYKNNKEKFNIYGVLRPSSDSGVDEPRKGKFRNTAVSASYNALDLDRYLLVDDMKTMRDIASAVPYDALIVMANIDRYGGGGIYNNYTIFTADDGRSDEIFMHEFGHGFGGLADEYFSSSVSYEEFYPAGFEPTEGNITALLNVNNVKWKDLLTPGIPVPTPWGQEETAQLEAERNQIRQKLLSDDITEQQRSELETQSREIRQKISEVRKKYGELYDGKIGVFEGAGYQAKGLYRSEITIAMFNAKTFSYGPVSERCITKVIEHYTD